MPIFIVEDPSQGVILQFRLRRLPFPHLLQIFLPSIILISLIYSTNYISSYYVDSIIVCAISLFTLSGLLLLHSSTLPSNHTKLSTTWLLACHAPALLQVLLLLRMNCLTMDIEVYQGLVAAITQIKMNDNGEKDEVCIHKVIYMP